jgi:transposase
MIYDTIKMCNLEGFADIIEDISVVRNSEQLYCYITLKKVYDPYPNCKASNPFVHGYYERKITHSISIGSPCFLIYKARKYKCRFCGKVYYENNPFSPKKYKTSTYTVLSVLEALRSHTSTFTAVAMQYNLTKQHVIDIFDEYVDCARKKFPPIICMDEFYTSKFAKHKYACAIVDFLSKELVDVYYSRKMYYLSNQLSQVPELERKNVKVVIIDMWQTYREIVHWYFRNAIVAVDSFHVIKHLNEAIAKIRIRVMNKFDKQTNSLLSNDMYYYMLKRFHYFFTKNFEDIYEGDIKIHKIHANWKKHEILKYLLSIDDDLKYAYLLKGKYREFNLTAGYENCQEELDTFIYEFTNSHITELRAFGNILRNWRTEIINSFIRINGRRLSNGVIESVNSRIKTIIKNVNGYINFKRLRNRIIFSINKNVPVKGKPEK